MTTTVHGKPGLPILGALLTAALAFALAQTLVVPAIPAITEAFDTTTSSATWVLTGFLLSASVCTPLAGKLGDLFGKGRVLTILLVVFALGSLVCAAASSIGVLVAGRIVQGVAAGVFPLAFGIINDEFPADRRAVAIGLMSAMFGIGGGLGLPLSGLLVEHVDISWLFSVGVLALPAAAGIHRVVPASPARERTRVDWLGAAILSGALVALLLGISKANTWGWGSAEVLGLLLGGAVLLATFVRVELHRPDPLVEIRVLGERPVLAVNVAAFLTGVAMFGSFLLIPQFTQTPETAGYGFGMSAVEAGLVMLPSSVAMLFAGPLAGALGNRIGFRAVLAIGTAFTIGSFLLLAVAHETVVEFLASGALIGVGIAFSFAAMANIIVGSVDRRDVGIATGINTIMRTIGGAFGSALVTALLTADTLPGSPLPPESAYTEAFVFSTVGATFALAAALAIPRIAGPRGGIPAPATA